MTARFCNDDVAGCRVSGEHSPRDEGNLLVLEEFMQQTALRGGLWRSCGVRSFVKEPGNGHCVMSAADDMNGDWRRRPRW